MKGYLTIAAAVLVLAASTFTAQPTPHHVFDVTASRYVFEPPTLDVHVGDLVRVTLRTRDIPHSFVVDGYRIAKKVSPGETVTFEFLADRAGRFTYYCSLTIDDGCRQMKGHLDIRPETAAPAGR